MLVNSSPEQMQLAGVGVPVPAVFMVLATQVGTLPLNPVRTWQAFGQEAAEVLGPSQVELVAGMPGVTQVHVWLAAVSRYESPAL